MVFRSAQYSAANGLIFSPPASRVSNSSMISGFSTGIASGETGPAHSTVTSFCFLLLHTVRHGRQWGILDVGSGEFEMSANKLTCELVAQRYCGSYQAVRRAVARMRVRHDTSGPGDATEPSTPAAAVSVDVPSPSGGMAPPARGGRAGLAQSRRASVLQRRRLLEEHNRKQRAG